jgi:hypothetical protein
MERAIWTRDEDRQLGELAREFGQVSPEDVRTMINVESKSDASIQVWLAKRAELVQSGSQHIRTGLLFCPNAEEIH